MRTSTALDNVAIGIKRCSNCGEIKPSDKFYFNATLQKSEYDCKDCRKAIVKARNRTRSPDEKRLHQELKYWRAIHRKFGLSPDDYRSILASQDYSCAICCGPQVAHYRYSVDHCHVTGKVRGLLCNKCNMALGLLSDDRDLMGVAAMYLEGIYFSGDSAPEQKYAVRMSSPISERGLSVAAFNAMVKSQYGRCAICFNDDSKLYIDHCHTTGTVRGLLCHSRNVGIGLLRDDAKVVLQAIEYLTKWKME